MNKNGLIKGLKIVSLLVGAIGLQSCSTIEIAHSPLNCMLYPSQTLGDRLSDEELNSISDPVFDKLEKHIISYQARIDSICESINKHNELHGKK